MTVRSHRRCHRPGAHLALATLLTALAAVAPAHAAEVEIVPFAGYRFDGLEIEQDLACAAIYASCTLRAEADDEPLLGLLVGVEVRPGWQVELLASRATSAISAQVELVPLPGNPAPGQQPDEEVDLETSHLQLGLSRHWGAARVRPFVGVAAGITRLELDAREPDPSALLLPIYLPSDASDDAFSASLAAGVEVDLSRRLGLRLEARGHWIDAEEELGGDFTQADLAAGLVIRI